MLSKRISKFVLGTAAVAGISSAANAGMLIDVRAVSVTGGSLVDPKTVVFAGPGSSVTMEIHAIISGSDSDTSNEGFSSVAGSFLSGLDGLQGNALVNSINPTFAGGGASVGKQQDLDSDGDLDVGSNNNGNAANFFAVRQVQLGPVIGLDHLLGTVTFTMTTIDGAANTQFNFRKRTSSTAGSWLEDGTARTSSNFNVGLPVNINVPEPSTLGLAAIGGLAMLARRRNA